MDGTIVQLILKLSLEFRQITEVTPTAIMRCSDRGCEYANVRDPVLRQDGAECRVGTEGQSGALRSEVTELYIVESRWEIQTGPMERHAAQPPKIHPTLALAPTTLPRLN